ncbi:MAG: glycosyltransferase N-terminal domain-containing protein [Candidatus Zixiibacteriota bacterium]
MLALYKSFTFLVYYITLPYTALAALLGSRKWRNRLGFHRVTRVNKTAPVVWLHASSMGEVNVLATVAAQIKNLAPQCDIYVTVMTATGLERAEKSIDDAIGAGYLSLDYRAPIERFLCLVKPSVAVFIETEIWPNHICLLGERKIPVILANGRLSEKAHKRYLKVKSGMRQVFSHYAEMDLQTESDAARFVEIGADPNKIEVLGSLKFDAPARNLSEAEKIALRENLPFSAGAKIFIAGSTRNGENEVILDVYQSLQREFPELKLLLVPRHLDKIPQIVMTVENRGLKYLLHSRLTPSGDVDLVVVDKMGILNDLYHISDIAFVGGTLSDIGGHNILEPVWAGIPVLYGPSIFNVGDSSRYILESGFGEMIKDGEELRASLRAFLAGERSYRRRSELTRESSRAYRTALKIVKYLK